MRRPRIIKRYPGGKNAEGTHQKIIGLQPTHAYYAEPFVGSGGVLRRKVPALQTVVCDRDAEIVDYWSRLNFPGVRALHHCGIAWLRDHVKLLDVDWLVYLDPPYLPETRVKKRMYKFEMTYDDHVELLRVIRLLNCNIQISGYSAPLYEETLRDWSRVESEVITRGGTKRTEVLWYNYPPPSRCYVAAAVPGRDFRERDRIKKRLRSWSGKYRAMPAYERTAVLAELIRTERTLDEAERRGANRRRA